MSATDQTQIRDAEEIRRLPRDQQDAILAAAALLAEVDYANVELTAFEAFGKDDLHGESSSSTTRRNLAG